MNQSDDHEPPPEIILPGNQTAGHHVAKRDVLVTDYRTILSELTQLTTVSVLLFGFLLTTAQSPHSGLEEWLFGAALILVSTATMVFILPVAYHHMQFPYEDFDKFQTRSHRWMLVGLPLLGGGLYLSLVLAIWNLFDAGALIIAAMPIIAGSIVFILRKGQF